jgi:hypothetical protein
MKKEIEKLIEDCNLASKNHEELDEKLSDIIFSVARQIDEERKIHIDKKNRNYYDWEIVGNLQVVAYWREPMDDGNIEFPLNYLWDADKVQKHIEESNQKDADRMVRGLEHKHEQIKWKYERIKKEYEQSQKDIDKLKNSI